MKIPGKLLRAYGAFLIVCGVVGWAATGFAPKAKTAILSGGVTGTLMVVLGLLALYGSARARVIAPWVGVFFALAFTSVFTWRASIAWQNVPAKLYVAILLSVMAVASVTAAALVAHASRQRRN